MVVDFQNVLNRFLSLHFISCSFLFPVLKDQLAEGKTERQAKQVPHDIRSYSPNTEPEPIQAEQGHSKTHM